MRERRITPYAPQRQDRRRDLFDIATEKVLRGEMTYQEYAKYASNFSAIADELARARLGLPQPSRPLKVKRFKPEFQGQKKHDPIPLTEHQVFPHAPLRDLHRAEVWSREQKETRLQWALNSYLQNHYTFKDYAREVRLYDEWGPGSQKEGRSSHILHQQTVYEQAEQLKVSDTASAQRINLPTMVSRIIAPFINR